MAKSKVQFQKGFVDRRKHQPQIIFPIPHQLE